MNDAQPLLNAIGFRQLLSSQPDGTVRVAFQPRTDFAHTQGTTVQGGFITAWLDNAMAFAVAARDPVVALATLEIKVSFLSRVPVAPCEVEARILRWGNSVVFLEAELFGQDGDCLATATSTGKLLRPRAK